MDNLEERRFVVQGEALPDTWESLLAAVGRLGLDIQEKPVEPYEEFQPTRPERGPRVRVAEHLDFKEYAKRNNISTSVAGRAWNILVGAYIAKNDKRSDRYELYKDLPIKFYSVPVGKPSSGYTPVIYDKLNIQSLQSLVEMIDATTEANDGDVRGAIRQVIPESLCAPSIVDVWRGVAAEALENWS